jgi:hypothetical protein
LGIVGKFKVISVSPLVAPNASVLVKLLSLNSLIVKPAALVALKKSKYPKKEVPLSLIKFSSSVPGVSSDPAEAFPTITFALAHCKYIFLVPRYTLFECS